MDLTRLKNRKVGGSIPSLPTRFAQLSILCTEITGEDQGRRAGGPWLEALVGGYCRKGTVRAYYRPPQVRGIDPGRGADLTLLLSTTSIRSRKQQRTR
jgi:hypothetical protein